MAQANLKSVSKKPHQQYSTYWRGLQIRTASVIQAIRLLDDDILRDNNRVRRRADEPRAALDDRLLVQNAVFDGSVE